MLSCGSIVSLSTVGKCVASIHKNGWYNHDKETETKQSRVNISWEYNVSRAVIFRTCLSSRAVVIKIKTKTTCVLRLDSLFALLHSAAVVWWNDGLTFRHKYGDGIINYVTTIYTYMYIKIQKVIYECIMMLITVICELVWARSNFGIFLYNINHSSKGPISNCAHYKVKYKITYQSPNFNRVPFGNG